LGYDNQTDINNKLKIFLQNYIETLYLQIYCCEKSIIFTFWSSFYTNI